MLVECRRCGAPLAVKRKAGRTKCRYCGSIDERKRMKAIVPETPKDFVPPKLWTPPPGREVTAKEPLRYNAPLSPFVAWGGALAFVAIVIGAPMLWESRMWNTRPEVLEHASPIGARKEVAKRLGGKLDSPTRLRVPLNSDRYEELVLRYANASDDVPMRFELEVRRGKNPDEGARDLLSRHLNGGLDDGNWRWGDVHLTWSKGGMSAELDRDGSPASLRRRQAVAAWTLILGAAFDPALSPPADELRDVMGGGYPTAMLAKLAPSTPLEEVKAKVKTEFPGALLEAKRQMIATIALDHPLFRSAELAWFVVPRGTLRDVNFASKPGLRAALDTFARCLTPALGAPRVTIVDPIAGTKSYTFYVKTTQIDLSTTLSVRAFGDHGVPATVDDDTWQTIVRTLDGCRR